MAMAILFHFYDCRSRNHGPKVQLQPKYHLDLGTKLLGYTVKANIKL